MSVTDHSRKPRWKSAFDEARTRIVSDFRESRFSWGGFFRWSGITLLAILIALIVTLYFLDWNQMRGPIGRYLSERTGREVRIDGNLGVKLFSFQPRMDVAGLFIGNPVTGHSSGVAQDQPHAATVERMRIEVRLMPLIFGTVILPVVEIHRPDLLVVRDAQGRTNWDPKSGASDDTAFKLPPIHRFLVQDGRIRIDDAVRKLHFTGSVSSEENAVGGRSAFSLTGDGTLNKNTFTANVTGGPLISVDAGKPYHFEAEVQAGDTRAAIKGAITRPFDFARFTAGVNISGRNLADLYFLTGLALPSTPRYRLAVAVARDGNVYRLNDLNGVLGSSDIAGNLAVDASGKIPRLTGKLASRSLTLDDLGPLVGGGEAQAPQSKYLLPDTPLNTDRLRQTNAQVDYSARSIKSRDFPLTSLDTHVGLEGGVLNLNPLAFGFTQGRLAGSLKIDARKEVPATSVDARITEVKAENFIKGTDKPLQGTLEARAIITGSGNSVHKAASTANGSFTGVVPSGGMRHTLAEWMGVNVLTALGLTLSGDNSNTNLRCAVAHFAARDGVLTAQRFVIDTDPVRVDGGGSINLRDETMNLRLQGKPKSFQFVRARAPITVSGSLAAPGIGIDAGPLVAQGAIGAALGFINPLASLLAFVDPGLAKDANCGPLLAEAKAKGAPVKQSAVRNAAKPRD